MAQTNATIHQTIEVFSNGTKVRLENNAPATIRGVTIYSPEWIKYLCVWWSGHERKEEWLHEREFTVTNGERTIGVVPK